MFNPFFEHADPEPILRDVFWTDIDWSAPGIFVQIQSLWSVKTDALGQWPPWYSEVEPIVIDREYFLNHSGGKFCSPLVKYYIDKGEVDDDGVLTDTAKSAIARIIIAKYARSWKRLWDVNAAAYNPINNYDMVETRTTKGASSEAKVARLDKTDEETETNEYGKTETVEHGRTSDSMTYRYGINTDTSDPKPSEKNTTEEGGATTTRDGGSDSTVRELSSGSDSTSNTVGATEEEEELHRSGNIGVTTTQKMIEEERRLWIWNYFDQVFSDLDQVLALSFHDPCRV